MRLRLWGIAMIALGFYLLGQAASNAMNPEGQTLKLVLEMFGAILVGGAGSVVYKYGKAKARRGTFNNSLDIIGKAKEE